MSLIDTSRLSTRRTINLRLAPEATAATEARHALDRLADLLPAPKLEDLRLVVSELVTNSVLHAGLSPDERISLYVEVRRGSVRGRVCDPGPGFEKPSEPGPRSDMRGGWGLTIVEKISDQWGVEKGRHVVCVWFEIA
jgi:anti-sigma regulatory factor (Ser/Thr protein kinase)